MVGINRRYLNNDNFVRARLAEQPFTASNANKVILQDKAPSFRVLDLTKSTFNDASCSYFHKSIGGYHGAKLQRYQDLIDEYLNPEIMDLVEKLPGQKPQIQLNMIMARQKVLNMLNMKYIILRPELNPLPNPNAQGPVWFAPFYEVVDNPDEEIAKLADINLYNTVAVDKRFADQVEGKSFVPDSAAKIDLTSYEPNHLQYAYTTNHDQLAVFSEIYYDKGWKAYLNGDEVPYLRANYVLRAMVVPAGDGIIEFKFEPRVWVVGEKVSFASSLLLILLLLGALVVQARKQISSADKG
jgi:hypothetical protein